MINKDILKGYLDKKVDEYNCIGFIKNDPICVPHSFTQKEDIEIMGFFAAIFAWGQRKTIINKAFELAQRMNNAPYEFVINHKESDLKKLLNFKHRTFNDTDLLQCIRFFKEHYLKYNSLEDAFFPEENMSVEEGLNYFHNYFFCLEDSPQRTKKHIPTPKRKSACKRLNMYLRWMIRNDKQGVDFGVWRKVKPKDLICPLDLHVERTARKIGILRREKIDWQAALELTEELKTFDPADPVKYDFALFGISIEDRCVMDIDS